MGRSANEKPNGMLLTHGADDLPSVTVDGYNIELRSSDGFLGDKANKYAFQEKLDAWRKRVRKGGTDPLGKTPTRDLSKKQVDALLVGDDKEAAAVVMGAVDDFAGELAAVLDKLLRQKSWKNTQRVVVGGGFRERVVGELAIARAMVLLKAKGIKIELSPIVHDPDDAGLIGAAHLIPHWMLKGHKAILAIDIGGTNIRVGIVEMRQKEGSDLSKAKVWKSDIWRHADDKPSRTTAIERLISMVERLIAKADKADLVPAPVIGLACPGVIDADGSIARGGQNLPGGNWESEHFNLPAEIKEAIPQIGEHETFVIMHNDAVVQGLSQVSFMQDVSGWGILTIGTGLGNAHFTNKRERDTD
ncbi:MULTISPECIES: ROK family protein [unclassified Sinorhizobium]|uniref:ROK family protein n=1 Tax=unclassified Sinorhizobium TaxID=2613772 RepID=UPI0024C22EA1|nr:MULTISPECIES: ROK family protein [unclassified Sinorhizobium]MDK1374507.1 ROK family protein [Sinorhizobium sp. 6-70]MDK1479163.1 ROK family protein [Sinorhizobium sp. 6-117]